MNCKHSTTFHQRVKVVQCRSVCNSVDSQDSNRNKVHCLTTSQRHIWGRTDVHTGFGEGRDHLEDLSVDESMILNWILKK